LELKDRALAIYQEVKEDEAKIYQALVLLGDNPDKYDKGDLREKIRTIAETNPTKFIDVLKDKDFEINFLIQSLVSHNIVKVIGSKYFDVETDKMIGSSLEETVVFFKDDTNSNVIGILKARLQDKIMK
jgi:hypothetical protein